MTDSRSIYISTNDPVLFLFMDESFHCVYVPHLYPFIYCWAFILFPCFDYCNIVNNGVQASFWIVVFLGYMPSSRISGSYGLLLGRKVVTNLDSIVKNRDIADEGPYSESYGFSSSHVWIWDLDHKEGWARKNWCFRTVVLEKTLESPLEIKPANPKGINPAYSLEGLMRKLKLLSFGRLRGRAGSLEKTLTLGKIESKSRRGQQSMRWLNRITDLMEVNLSKLQRW